MQALVTEIKSPSRDRKKGNATDKHLRDVIHHLNEHAAVYEKELVKAIDIIRSARDHENDVFMYGSGFNAEIAGHAVVDWVKFANVKALEVGIPTLTAYGNDYRNHTGLRQYFEHRKFGKSSVLVGVNIGPNDEALKTGMAYCASAGGKNVLITNNKFQLSQDVHSCLYINTDDAELAGDIAQTFTHFIAVALAQDLNADFVSEWTRSYRDYALFLCQALQDQEFYEDRLKLIGNVIHHTLLSGRSIYAFGNGGSAAMSAYFVENLQKIYKEFPFALRNIINLSLYHHMINESIKTDSYKGDIYTSILTQLGVVPGDILVGISTSGNSNNIIHPFVSFPQLQKVAILGFGDGGELGAMHNVDFSVIVPDEFSHRSYAIAEDGQRMALTAIIKHLKWKLKG